MTREQENHVKCLSFWTMAFSYLKLTQSSLEETIKRNNRWVIFSSSPLAELEYEEATKWSDFRIVISVLFNFYHGLELLLKGFVLAKSANKQHTPNHNICDLIADFKNLYPTSRSLIIIFDKYISDPPEATILRDFCNDNKIDVNKFYENLRYPSNRAMDKMFTHFCLKYRERDDESLLFFKGLVNDITQIFAESVPLGRSFEPTPQTQSPSSEIESR
jgi:hypothetical protein